MQLLGRSTLAERRLMRRLPWGLLSITACIAVASVVNLASAARAEPGAIWLSQAIWFGIGAALALALLSLDYRILHRLAWPLYVGVLGLLAAVELKGATVMGAQRWLVLGPVRMQPSEMAKLAVVLVLARYFHEEGERPRGYRLIELWRPALIVGLPYAMILAQPDLGTATMLLAVAGTMVLAARVRWTGLLTLGIAGASAAIAGWSFVLKDYQKRRVLTFLDPEGDALGAGYHANQSIIAVGSGQWAGKGWGMGSQTQLSFLPEQHTDFVFSVFAEEWGLRGCLVLLALFLALIVVALGIASQARDRHGAFLAIGACGLLFWHVFVNIGMVSGILPVVGVTLPLMSYGGSSAITVFLAIGVLANVAVRRYSY